MAFWNKLTTPDTAPELANQNRVSQSGGVSPNGKSTPPAAIQAQPTPTSQPAPETQNPATNPLAKSQVCAKDPVTQRFGFVRSALSKGTVIQGKLSFDTPVRIDGKLSGEVYSSDALIVGPDGKIDADIKVKTLVVIGTVTGVVRATESIEILAGGNVTGEIITPSLSLQEGGKLNGRCWMTIPQTEILTVNLELMKPTDPVPSKQKAAKEDSKSSDKTATDPDLHVH